ncbi:MAG: glycosyltransferase family 2 protein [Vicinamibacterales bacterium]
MIEQHKVVVVMPAYNAARTLDRTYREVASQSIVDTIIVVDDGSGDGTPVQARSLPDVVVHEHAENRGYGANQKTCYRLALEHGADIVVMVHPDYQYTPRLIPAMAGMVASGLFPCVIASRILGGRALEGGMPLWRYVGNRALTLAENALIGTKVSEFHSGYRAFSRNVLEALPLEEFSDDFLFDNEILAEIAWRGLPIGEVSCPTRYAAEASSINFSGSVRYGLGCLAVGVKFRLARMRLVRSNRLRRRAGGRRGAALAG